LTPTKEAIETALVEYEHALFYYANQIPQNAKDRLAQAHQKLVDLVEEVEETLKPVSALLTRVELMERLADIEHQRWASWQAWVHKIATPTPSGALIIPAPYVERWERQINTPYADLSEEDKEKDRKQVRKYWHLIEPFLPVDEEAIAA
jgi:hypothetical protein